MGVVKPLFFSLCSPPPYFQSFKMPLEATRRRRSLGGAGFLSGILDIFKDYFLFLTFIGATMVRQVGEVGETPALACPGSP
jgi:hypothetical protein